MDKQETQPAEQPVTAVATVPPKKAELVAGERVAPIIPRTIEEVGRIANAVIIAGLAPDSYQTGSRDETASKIMIGIMKGAEIGLGPLTALASIAIINGRASLWGDGAVALVQASGKVKSWSEEWVGTEGSDDWTAVCTIWRVGQDAPYVGKFSWADAKRAKLTNRKPYIEHPATMIMWRARSKTMRTGFADCLSGLAIAEEVQDIPPPPPPAADTSVLDDDAPEQTSTPEAAA